MNVHRGLCGDKVLLELILHVVLQNLIRVILLELGLSLLIGLLILRMLHLLGISRSKVIGEAIGITRLLVHILHLPSTLIRIEVDFIVKLVLGWKIVVGLLH